jgi:hypothetical protein
MTLLIAYILTFLIKSGTMQSTNKDLRSLNKEQLIARIEVLEDIISLLENRLGKNYDKSEESTPGESFSPGGGKIVQVNFQ